MFGAMAFGGVFIACLITPPLGDKYGRRIGWLVAVTLQLPLYFAAGLTDNIGVIYVVVWYLGMGLIGRFIFGFTLMTEVSPLKHQAIAGTLFQALDAVAPLYVTLFIS